MSEDSEQYRPSANEPAQDWPAAMLALFGKRLDDDEVEGIESECNNVFRGTLRKWELTKAVRYCAMNGPSGGRKYAPTGEEIIRAIKANRHNYAQKKGTEGYCAHSCQMGYGLQSFEEWSRDLKQADSKDERWNIICRPYDAAHCQQREKFCRENSLRFNRYDPSAIQEFAHV